MLPTRNIPHQHTHKLKVKGWEMMFHATVNQKWTRVTLLIWDKIKFKTVTVKIGKEQALCTDKKIDSTGRCDYSKWISTQC